MPRCRAQWLRERVQNPAYMVFACLVADQDLLFCTYDVPCISICRAEQRAKALERLGMPASVYSDIHDRGGNAPVVTGALPTRVLVCPWLTC